jgi:hypothetical protein
MKKLLCVVAAAAAMGLVPIGSASAVTCTGTCVGVTPASFTGAGGIGVFTDNAVPTGAFTDQFEFQLVAPPNFFNTVSNEITSSGVTFDPLTLSIWSCTDVGCGTSSQIASNSSYLVDGTGQHIQVIANAVGPGYYFIQVAGTSPSAGGYGGTLTVTASVVPLPAALPLFASGLSVLGIAGWRKRRKVKHAA